MKYIWRLHSSHTSELFDCLVFRAFVGTLRAVPLALGLGREADTLEMEPLYLTLDERQRERGQVITNLNP